MNELSGRGFGPVSLQVRSGEIVGVAGAEGNGQRALLRGIIGIDRTAGSVDVDGKALSRVTPATALAAGISFQSGDRAAESSSPRCRSWTTPRRSSGPTPARRGRP